MSKNLINVDMVVQNISLNGKETDLTFTIKSADLKKIEKLIKQNKKYLLKNFLLTKMFQKFQL